uniref:Uncharacterized protein n=1 Tax=Arundo donax TaxID=35708 RepID=A0A0A9H1E9_ARUDO
MNTLYMAATHLGNVLHANKSKTLFSQPINPKLYSVNLIYCYLNDWNLVNTFQIHI